MTLTKEQDAAVQWLTDECNRLKSINNAVLPLNISLDEIAAWQKEATTITKADMLALLTAQFPDIQARLAFAIKQAASK